jgi:hypothetical protein
MKINPLKCDLYHIIRKTMVNSPYKFKNHDYFPPITLFGIYKFIKLFILNYNGLKSTIFSNKTQKIIFNPLTKYVNSFIKPIFCFDIKNNLNELSFENFITL